MQATNTSGQNESRLDEGDTIVFTFSEPIDPTSIIAGWDGTGSQNVVIRLSDTDLLENDEILFYDATNSTQLPLAKVDLGRTDYVAALFGEGNVTYGAPGTATPSTMTISGNTVTIVLGTYTEPGGGQGNRETTGGTGTLTWLNPAAAIKDFAGNPLAPGSPTQSRWGPTRQRLLTLPAIRPARRRGPRTAIAAAPGRRG